MTAASSIRNRIRPAIGRHSVEITSIIELVMSGHRNGHLRHKDKLEFGAIGWYLVENLAEWLVKAMPW